MNLLAALRRPEYVLRPTQIVRRLIYEFGPHSAEYETVRLPWGLPIRVQPNETVGSGIRRLGIHELPSSECISRLIDSGDLVVDVGANIGHMTSIMAMRAGPNGKVIAFEPHPVLFSELQYNIAVWRRNPQAAPIVAHNRALSSHTGVAQLVVPADFEMNHGVCSLAGNTEANLHGNHFEVAVTTLRAAVDEGKQIGFLKIDVEGHELQVLIGAQDLLTLGNIRDILFEEQRTIPTPVTELLEDSGYTIYRVDGGLLGPITASIKTSYSPIIVNDSANYLATRDPSRLLRRTSQRGWMVFSNAWTFPQ
ncbi:MAG: FkbM family methyltransferase [Terracidiphilus sp.]